MNERELNCVRKKYKLEICIKNIYRKDKIVRIFEKFLIIKKN